MSSVYKLGVILIVFILALFLAIRIYPFFNTRIRNSESGWSLLLNAVLMIIAFTALFAAGVIVLVYAYSYLAGASAGQ